MKRWNQWLNAVARFIALRTYRREIAAQRRASKYGRRIEDRLAMVRAHEFWPLARLVSRLLLSRDQRGYIVSLTVMHLDDAFSESEWRGTPTVSRTTRWMSDAEKNGPKKPYVAFENDRWTIDFT